MQSLRNTPKQSISASPHFQMSTTSLKLKKQSQNKSSENETALRPKPSVAIERFQVNQEVQTTQSPLSQYDTQFIAANENRKK